MTYREKEFEVKSNYKGSYLSEDVPVWDEVSSNKELLKELIAEIKLNKLIISGSPGPLFDMGWSSAVEMVVDILEKRSK